MIASRVKLAETIYGFDMMKKCKVKNDGIP